MIRKFLKAIKDKTQTRQDTDRVSFYQDLEIDVLARTLWGEARGEGKQGMEAVACVILNRVAVAKKMNGYWWGADIIQVCQKPYQFSCWNKNDPNYTKLTQVDESDIHFATARRIARRAAHNCLEDITKGSTHYHAHFVKPYWTKNADPTIRIGDHLFYKLVEV